MDETRPSVETAATTALVDGPFWSRPVQGKEQEPLVPGKSRED